jgi:hypothetical protein
VHVHRLVGVAVVRQKLVRDELGGGVKITAAWGGLA